MNLRQTYQKEDVNKYYEIDAGETYDNIRSKGIKGNYINRLNESILLELIGNPNGKKILDAGCGTGRNSLFLAKMGAEVTCYDQSKKMLDYCENKMLSNNLNLNFERGDIEKMPFPNNHFDGVLSTRVLIHFQNPEVALTEMSRVVKEGGFVIVDAHNLFRLDILRTFTRRFLNYHKTKIGKVVSFYWTPSEIKRKYTSQNLTLSDIFGDKIIPPYTTVIKLIGAEKMLKLDNTLGQSFLKYIGAECYLKFVKSGKEDDDIREHHQGVARK